MNILPLKKWHVRRKENVERVRRDEAEARAKEEELQRRAEIAEREARLELMKRRARERDGYSSGEEDKAKHQPSNSGAKDKPSSSTPTGNINFFADLEQGVGVQLTNAEHDAEKKAEQEKLEKRIGLLNYLVDKDKSEEPWYSHKKSAEESAKSKQRKELMDPMNKIKEFLVKKRKADNLQGQMNHIPSTRPTATPSIGLLDVNPDRTNSLKHKEELNSERALHHTQKHKHKHKKHKKDKHKFKDELKAEKQSQLEMLRRERRKREEAERARAEAMLKGHYGGQGSGETSQDSASSVVERPGRYFSQFNPHLARQHRGDQ